MADKNPMPYIAVANGANVGQFATLQEAINAAHQAGGRMKVFQQEMKIEVRDANNCYFPVVTWKL